MRTWLIPAALAVLLSLATSAVGLAASAATPAPTATAPAKPATSAPTATKAAPTPTPQPPPQPAAPAVQQTVEAQVASASKSAPTAPVPPTSTPIPEPTAPAVHQTVEAQIAAASKAPSSTEAPNAAPAASPGLNATVVRAAFSIAGIVFLDPVGSGYVAGAPRVPDVQVQVVGPTGRQWLMRTDPAGVFRIDGLTPGGYHLSVQAPRDLTAGTGAEQDVQVTKTAQQPLLIGLSPANTTAAAPLHDLGAPQLTPPSPEPSPTATAEETPAAEEVDAGEQDAAVLQLLSLPLRFAPGRDTLAQVDRRTLADGSIWLGVPFRTQIDGTEYQFVNCGPASLTMVLAGFGLQVGPDEVRNYLNTLTRNFSTDVGTSLDVLSAIGRQAGLVPIDLYSGRGGYRTWTPEAIRWHVQQGHPVITLVKYHNLPGHWQSSADTDHYVVITGLTPDGFIYNDAAFATTVGYGLEITDAELETAWDNSSIPHNAVALALPQSGGSLSFPETARPTPEPHHIQGGPLFGTGRDDDLPPEQLPLPTRVARATPAPVADPDPAPALPEGADPAEYDSATSVPADPVAETPQVVVDPGPGPLRLAPEVAVLLGSLWTMAMAWSGLSVLARRLPAFGSACVRAAVVLASFRVF